MTEAERFDELAEAFAGLDGVGLPGESGRGFGADAPKVPGSIVAMLSHGRLVVKPPRQRVRALIPDRTGGQFDAGKGTPMRELLTVEDGDDGVWVALAREAMDFVGSKRR